MKPSFRPASLTLLTALVVAVGALGLFFAHASAQQPTPSDDDVNAVARQLFCPVCENTPLDVCPTVACAQWRDLIREKLAAGWSSGQIKEYFVTQYGDRVLAEPPKRGFNWLVYVLPPLFFLIGVVILVRVLRASRRPAASPDAPRPDVEKSADPYLSELEEELARRKKS